MHITYWVSTIAIALLLIASAYTYLLHQSTIDGIRSLGFPDFFRVQLAVLKVIAALVIALPQFSIQVKEWSYAGAGLFLLTAIVAHTAHKDSLGITAANLVFFGILATSNISLHKLTTG